MENYKKVRTAIISALKEKGEAFLDELSAFSSVSRADAMEAVKLLLTNKVIGFEKANVKEAFTLTEEGQKYSEEGTPEFQVFSAIPPEGISRGELESKFGASTLGLALKQLFAGRAIQMEKIEGVEHFKRKIDAMTDEVRSQLVKCKNNEALPDAVLKRLRARKLIALTKEQNYRITKGEDFNTAEDDEGAVGTLTAADLEANAGKAIRFKKYDFQAKGIYPTLGYSHPLMDMREHYRQIFLSMGFKEMQTDSYVESSFWNFDGLIQPQQHPARDMHDTFFVDAEPDALANGVDTSRSTSLPENYKKAVCAAHEDGTTGSLGYRYIWSEEEARKNILRTHTTAVSTRVLYTLQKLAGQKHIEGKYFSIDRVYRNETLDATHLAEFNQVEGFVVGDGLSLCDLMRVIKLFFTKLGMSDVRFKPAYNPYTEPSMEIFAYHPELKKMVEVGNSGVFRPEMLRPMGIPPETSVIAWGLSLERPTMILHQLSNIRDLFGSGVDIDMLAKSHY